MKKRSFKSLMGLAVLTTLLASCAAPELPTDQVSSSSGSQASGDIIVNDYSSLNVTVKGYLNGKEDTDNTAATVEVETKDNITGVVIVSVQLKSTYGVYNAVARNKDGRSVTISNSSKVGNTVRYYLQLSDSDLDVTIYLGKDVSTALPDEGWNSLLETINSPINSANISSEEADIFMNANLSFSNYFYVGKTKDGNDFSTAHNFYSSQDIEANTFVSEPSNKIMSYIYLGTNNQPAYKSVYDGNGDPYEWYAKESRYLNPNSANDMVYSPYQETPLSLYSIPTKGSTVSGIDILKSRFSAVATGDGNVTFTNKVSSTDLSTQLPAVVSGQMVFDLNNNVYGAFMIQPNGASTLKIRMNLNDYKIQQITMTQPWVFQETNSQESQVFTFKADFTSWNTRTYAEAYPGSWVKENASVSSIYKPVENLDPTPTPIVGNAVDNISDAPALTKLRQGNYTLDIKTSMITSDGWFDGVSGSAEPFEGTLKVNVSDETTTNKNKGVVSTLPTVTGRDTNTYDGVGFYNGVYGKVNAAKTGLTTYGVTSAAGATLASKKLATNDIPLTALFKGDKTQGFQITKSFLDEQGTFNANNAIFTGKFFDNGVMSSSLSGDLFKQLGSPLDFAFGQNPFSENDQNFALLYGYIAQMASIKRATIDFSKADEINITYDGTVRLYGEYSNFSINYRYYNLGTTDLTDQEAQIIAQLN